jgi:hypothetical protein
VRLPHRDIPVARGLDWPVNPMHRRSALTSVQAGAPH